MTKKLSTIHLIVGIGIVIVFLYTGRYMRSHFPALYQSNEVIRYLFRARHIYILLTGLVNIGIGAYFLPRQARWQRYVQVTGSGFLLTSPVIMVWAFFTEPMQASAEHSLTLLGAILALAGTLFHMISGFGRERQ